MPMMIFSLEFIRQSLAIYQLHIVPTKKGHLLKLGMHVGPFVVNVRQAFETIEALLKEMKFSLREIWHYDPHGGIARRREKIKALTYLHESKPELEWKYSIESWPLDIEMEIDALTNKCKPQKRHVGQSGDTEMVKASSSKKAKT